MLDPGRVGERLAPQRQRQRVEQLAQRLGAGSAAAARRPRPPRPSLRIPRAIASAGRRSKTKSTASPTVSIRAVSSSRGAHPVGVLELHHQLVEVERVRVEVLPEPGRLADLGRRRPRARSPGARAPSPSPGPGSAPSSASFLSRIAPRVAPERCEQLRGPVDRVDLDRARREPDRVRDPVRRRSCRGRPRRRRAGRAGSRRRSCRGPSRGAGRRAPGAAAGRRPRRPGSSARPRRRRRRPSCAVPSIVFSATLPVKPSVTTTSAVAAEQVAALDVAAEVELARPPASSACASTTSCGALLRLLADREQRHPRALDPEHRVAEGRAQVGELDQVAGADLGVGADVEQQGRRADRGRAPRAARRAPGGARRAARRSANSAAVIVAPVGPALASACELPVGDVGGGEHDRGLGRVAHGADRVLVVGDLVGGREQLDPVDALELRELGRVAEHAQADPVGRPRRGRRRRSPRRPARPRGRRGRPWSPALLARAAPGSPSRLRRSRARSPRAPRRCRRRGRRDAAGAGCGSAGTR